MRCKKSRFRGVSCLIFFLQRRVDDNDGSVDDVHDIAAIPPVFLSLFFFPIEFVGRIKMGGRVQMLFMCYFT